MIDYIFALFLVFIGLGTVYSFRKYMDMKSAALKEYIKVSKEFFDATQPLLSDAETPDFIIDTIRILGETINDKSIARFMLRRIKSGKWKSFSASEEVKLTDEFLSRRPELQKSHDKMFMAWFLAITALSPLAGRECRYALHESTSQKNASAQASRDRYARYHRDGNNDNCPPPNVAALAS